MNSNFEFLAKHDPLLLQLAKTAESAFVPDPNTTLVKLRQLGEALAQDIGARLGLETDSQTRQLDLLREIDATLRLDRNVNEAFHQLRKLGNQATHDFSSSTHRDALNALQIAFALSGWFHKTFGGDKAKSFKLGEFKKPQDPSIQLRLLEEKLSILQIEQQRTSERLEIAEQLKLVEAEKAQAEAKRADEIAEEKAIWEELAQEQESKAVELTKQFEKSNAERKATFIQLGEEQQAEFIKQVEKSNLELSEAETRVLIDQQLVETGWEADTENLTQCFKGHYAVSGCC